MGIYEQHLSEVVARLGAALDGQDGLVWTGKHMSFDHIPAPDGMANCSPADIRALLRGLAETERRLGELQEAINRTVYNATLEVNAHKKVLEDFEKLGLKNTSAYQVLQFCAFVERMILPLKKHQKP